MGHRPLCSVANLLAIVFLGVSVARETLAYRCNDDGLKYASVYLSPGAVKNLNTANSNTVQVTKECKNDNDCKSFCSIGHGCCALGKDSDEKSYCSCAISQDDPCPVFVSGNRINAANDAGTSKAVTLSVNSFTVFYNKYDVLAPTIDYDVSDGDVYIRAVAAITGQDDQDVVSLVEVCGKDMGDRIAKEQVKQWTVDQWMDIMDQNMFQQIAEKFEEK